MMLPLLLYGLNPIDFNIAGYHFTCTYSSPFHISHSSRFNSLISISFMTSLPSIHFTLQRTVMLHVSWKTDQQCPDNNKSYCIKLALLLFLQMVSRLTSSLCRHIIPSFQEDMKRRFKLGSEEPLSLCFFYYFMLPLENKTYQNRS